MHGIPDIVDPEVFEREGYPHALWTELRASPGLGWFECVGKKPFWAVTRHDDIVRISRQPRLFTNGPRFVVDPQLHAREAEGERTHHLLNMDPPEHGAYRRLVSRHFTPGALRKRMPRIEEIARGVLDRVAVESGTREGDFVGDVASELPLAVIAELLGVAEEDWPLLFRWTNQIGGSGDPEYQRGGTPAETLSRAEQELFVYFSELVAERRANPRDDLISVLAGAELEGEALPVHELLSYFFLLVVAGNETTRNATTGGLLALIEHPDAFERLRREPDLLEPAVEEILRWTSPVIHFCRTATRDTEVSGQPIRAGQSLVLFYPSANRDESVFDDPFAFRIDRRPNPHLAFGIGEHFCLGANLARVELRVIFRQLIDRLDSVELAGPVERLRSPVLGGLKHMPLRYALRAA